MAVYKRTYQAYSGPLTPQWSRMLVIPRYAWANLFQQRIVTMLYMAAFLYPLGAALAIYFNNNLGFLRQYVPVPDGGFFSVNNNFFFVFTTVQCSLGFVLAALVGPGLMSPDLTHNALPLFFARPLSRPQYIGGKMLVLAGLLSSFTWIPGLALFVLQASLAPGDWFWQNGWIGWAMSASFLLWITVISLLALALSAWVRWKLIAGALMLVVMFLGAGMAEMIRQVARSEIGGYFDIANSLTRIFIALFRLSNEHPMELEEAIAAVALCSGLLLFLIAKKVKAYEVVRG